MSELSITRKHLEDIADHVEELEELYEIYTYQNKHLKAYLDKTGLSSDEINNITWGMLDD